MDKRVLMTRSRFPLTALIVLGLVILALGMKSYDGTEVRGELRGTDQEVEEGYFAVGGETMVVVKPGSPLHRWLRGHVGQCVLVTLQPEPSE